MEKEEVIKRIGKGNWKSFLKFMAGQTIGITKEGKMDYYECDVKRFEEHIEYRRVIVKHLYGEKCE